MVRHAGACGLYLPLRQLALCRHAERMPKSDRVLAGIIDMRVPLTFSLEDCAQIARIIRAEVSAVYQGA